MSVTIDLQQTEIFEFEIERANGGHSIYFSVEGAVEDVDEESLKEAFEAQQLQPVEIVIETGNQSAEERDE